jgi:histidinol dehydrogenase
VRCERLTLAGGDDVVATAGALRALIPPPESVRDAVAEIIAQVRARGDSALSDFTRTFDTAGADPLPPLVPGADLDLALDALDPRLRHGLERAVENVEAVSSAWGREPDRVVVLKENRVVLRQAPVASAAVYVPGGRAPYPSTVVMGVVPARLAGVQHIVVVAPPRRDGDLDPTVLAACRLTGATAVYRMGGAQAIAALAYGTESIPPVDVIVGPGNLYVQEAKRQAYGQVGIDGFAGPSDLMVVASGDADPRPLALDLLAQAEHGPGTIVAAVSESARLLDEIEDRLRDAADTGAVSGLVQAGGDLINALALAEAFAPEHLELVGAAAERLAEHVTRAGCLFVGAGAGTAFGDYIVGSNHILPTAGAARFASGLSPQHFLRRFAEVHVDAPNELARCAAPLARAEGFELHAESMEARIRDNGPT